MKIVLSDKMKHVLAAKMAKARKRQAAAVAASGWPVCVSRPRPMTKSTNTRSFTHIHVKREKKNNDKNSCRKNIDLFCGCKTIFSPPSFVRSLFL